MALTNTRLAMASYALSAGGTSGFSMVGLSYVLSAPNDFWPNNTFAVTVTNGSTTAPILVEVRNVWQGINNVSCVTPLTIDMASNNQSFGNSGGLPVTAMLLTSGKGGTLPCQNVVGSAVQVVIMAASTVADAAGCSGQIVLWRAQ